VIVPVGRAAGAGYRGSMRIAVDKTGGMFPVSRRVEIDDDTLRVIDRPVDRPGQDPVHREARLAPADVVQLRHLASRVAAAGDQIDDEPGGVDGGTTVVEVDDGHASSRVEIRMGSTTGSEVWDLLDVVERLTPDG
jgi:hypothetical protein